MRYALRLPVYASSDFFSTGVAGGQAKDFNNPQLNKAVIDGGCRYNAAVREAVQKSCAPPGKRIAAFVSELDTGAAG
jgi:hypothetical protein